MIVLDSVAVRGGLAYGFYSVPLLPQVYPDKITYSSTCLGLPAESWQTHLLLLDAKLRWGRAHDFSKLHGRSNDV